MDFLELLVPYIDCGIMNITIMKTMITAHDSLMNPHCGAYSEIRRDGGVNRETAFRSFVWGHREKRHQLCFPRGPARGLPLALPKPQLCEYMHRMRWISCAKSTSEKYVLSVVHPISNRPEKKYTTHGWQHPSTKGKFIRGLATRVIFKHHFFAHGILIHPCHFQFSNTWLTYLGPGQT